MDCSLLELSRNPALRLYSWDPPGLSIGHFQDASEPWPPEALKVKAQMVRRPTGGGAILHLREEFTFSLILPRQDTHRAPPTKLYRQVGEAISRAAAELGVSLLFRGTGDDRREDPFLCFERTSCWDLVDSTGAKAAGFAARKNRYSTLVHGSISPHTGLTHHHLVPIAPQAFSDVFQISWRSCDLDSGELDFARILQKLPLERRRQKRKTEDF
ncbi:MAG: hypothetical protein QF752_14395 [Planctomycetota bacterium]|nr:hypothetical protein [Planctomycetota bacterium]